MVSSFLSYSIRLPNAKFISVNGSLKRQIVSIHLVYVWVYKEGPLQLETVSSRRIVVLSNVALISSWVHNLCVHITFEIQRTSRIQFAVSLPTQVNQLFGYRSSWCAIDVGYKFWSLSMFLNRSPPRIPQMVHVAVVTSSRRKSWLVERDFQVRSSREMTNLWSINFYFRTCNFLFRWRCFLHRFKSIATCGRSFFHFLVSGRGRVYLRDSSKATKLKDIRDQVWDETILACDASISLEAYALV